MRVSRNHILSSALLVILVALLPPHIIRQPKSSSPVKGMALPTIVVVGGSYVGGSSRMEDWSKATLTYYSS